MYRVKFTQDHSAVITFATFDSIEDAFKYAKAQHTSFSSRTDFEILEKVADVVLPSSTYELRIKGE